MPVIRYHKIMVANPGYQPKFTRGRRVHVITRGGYDTRRKEPNGWAADTTEWRFSKEQGRGKARALPPSAEADVIQYMLIQ